MLNYRTPGVYIEEISTMPASIAEVETAIPAFVGYTRRRSGKRERIPRNMPFLIHSLEEYEKYFGDPFKESFSVTLKANVAAVNNTSITVKPDNNGLSNYLMHYCMQFYFGNGGGRCYIVSVGDCYDKRTGEKSIKLDDLEAGLKSLENENDPTVLVIPEAVKLKEEERKTLHEKMLDQCGELKDRFAILDVLESGGNDTEADAGRFRDKETGMNHLDYGAAYYPSMHTTIRRRYDERSVVITDIRRDVGRGNVDAKTLAQLSANENHKLLCRQIKKELNKIGVRLYPSAAIAGIYARVDRERGVWKAPANVNVNLVESPFSILTNQDQSVLNFEANSGKSINAIRNFLGRGTLVWGARTLAGNDNEWRYVPVRRLAIFIRKSINRSFGTIISEPDNADPWSKIRSVIEAFLNGLWRKGALTGATPDKAYFVKTGPGQTMTADDIQNGRVNVEVGIAALRPAEFIILKFTFKLEES